MNYSDFTVQDFVCDEYFQQWVLEPEAMSERFWAEWLVEHPHKANELHEARKIIQDLAVERHELTDQDFNTMWQQILQKREEVSGAAHLHGRNQSSWKSIRIAAAATLLLIGAAALYFVPKQQQQPEAHSQIVLELSDGTQHAIDEANIGVISSVDGTDHVAQQHNVLDYTQAAIVNDQPIFNQLTVPYGKKFEIKLSDGSTVLLNAGTKLRYPVAFVADKPRDVFLDGEAYFKVTKDASRPFTVITDQMNTRVYGTEFNVSSYKNENNTSTVLIEGSVGIYEANNAQGSKPLMLEPGQRGRFNGGAIEVGVVNVEKYTAWTTGKLYFVNDRFDLILRELERHFDVTISNDYHQIDSQRFTGTFDKESLEEILTIFSLHTPFRFEILDKNIIIKNEK